MDPGVEPVPTRRCDGSSAPEKKVWTEVILYFSKHYSDTKGGKKSGSMCSGKGCVDRHRGGSDTLTEGRIRYFT